MASLQDYLYRRPNNRVQVKAWVKEFLGFELHDNIRCKKHDHELGTPHACQLDYVSDAFLNVYSSAVIMAARNAGKSYAAAVLNVLDCWHNPGVKVAVAAYIRSQSDYIYTYMVQFLDHFAKTMGWQNTQGGNRNQNLGRGRPWVITKDEILFDNGSSVKFFSGGKSTAGIKGFHPNRLQVDECDLFTAAQFDGLANSLEAGSQFDRRFDVLSTNYTVAGDGVVLKQIARYEEFNKTRNPHVRPCKVYKICLLDILEKCDNRFQCIDDKGIHCPLWKYCKGAAKEGDGFYKITSAFETMRDSSKPTFESQMLLLRPSSEFSYFHNFSMADNVADDLPFNPEWDTFIAFDFGGSRCPHAALVVQRSITDKKAEGGTYHVLDEFTAMGNLESLTAKVKARYPNAVDFITYYDPKGNDRANFVGGQSYASILRREGFYPRCKQLKRRHTFELIFRLIEPAAGPTRIKITKRCTMMIKQIQAAEHERKLGRITEEPADGAGDDLLDCLRYIIGWTQGTYAKHNSRQNLILF